MKKYLILCIELLLIISCDKDDGTLYSSQNIRNWLIIEDTSDDPIDQQRYRIFKETGIPVFYNDTIGSEERYTLTGMPYTYYEKLQVFYTPGVPFNSSSAKFMLVEDKSALGPILDFLELELFPMIKKAFHIPSILLVDSLVNPRGSDKLEYKYAYKGYSTLVFSEVVDEFPNMTKDEREQYKAMLLQTMIEGTLMAEDKWLTENFYALSYAVNPQNKNFIYSSSTRAYMVSDGLRGLSLSPEEQKLHLLGFIGTMFSFPGMPESNWIQPTKEQDVSQFCRAVLTKTKVEFEAEHGEEPVVMAKYQAIRQKLLDYGFVLE